MEQLVPFILEILNSPAMRTAVRSAFPQVASLEALEGKILHDLKLIRFEADSTSVHPPLDKVNVEYRATATSEEFYWHPIQQLQEAGVIHGADPYRLMNYSGKIDNHQEIVIREGGLELKLNLLPPTPKA